MRTSLLAALLAAPGLLSALELDGNYVIVTPENAIATEAKAAEILGKWLGEMLGTRLVTVSEKDGDGNAKALVVGWSQYTEKNGVDLTKAGCEECCVRAMKDGCIILSGGRTRGTLYAVYEFLEFAGCRYLACDAKYIPKVTSVTVPDDLLINKEPFFNKRHWYTGFYGPNFVPMAAWNRANMGVSLDRKDAAFYRDRQHGFCNTFFNYGEELPKDKPEYFSLKDGKRQRPVDKHGPGQLCLWHPEVRELVAQSLRRKIEADKAKCAETGWPRIGHFLISINDNRDKCTCDGCNALAEKYGSYGGALIDFINAIARETPEVTVITRAYMAFEQPPKPGSIKALPNVMLSMAYIGREFQGAHDTMRPLTDPMNKETWDNMKGWKHIVDHFDVWDYRKVFKCVSPVPYTNIPVIKADLPTLADFGVRRYFAEDEYFGRNGLGMKAMDDLGAYLAMRLLIDPYQDSQALQAEFMDKYYGAAAPKMQEYLDYIIKRQFAWETPLGAVPDSQWEFLDLEFFNTVYRLIGEAEALVKDDPKRLERVRTEHIPVNSAMLIRWRSLTRKGLKLDRDTVLKQMQEASESALKRYCPPRGKLMAERARVARLHHALKPIQGFPEGPIQVTATRFTAIHSAVVSDPEAFDHSARRLRGPQEPEANKRYHGKKVEFGIQNRTLGRPECTRRIDPDKVPRDERYHFYKIGTFRPNGNVVGWVHWTWHIQYPVASFFDLDEKDTEFDAYISLKVEGPAYVKGSNRANALTVDRIIFTPKGAKVDVPVR